MIIKLRKDESGKWGIVEKHNTYSYKGVVNVTHVFNLFSEPLVYKGGFFISTNDIDETVGIKGYLGAKKPFYSILNKNSCIVELKVKYQKDEIIDINLFLLKPISTKDDELVVQKVKQNIPISMEMRKVLEGSVNGDREKFLEGRRELFSK